MKKLNYDWREEQKVHVSIYSAPNVSSCIDHLSWEIFSRYGDLNLYFFVEQVLNKFCSITGSKLKKRTLARPNFYISVISYSFESQIGWIDINELDVEEDNFSWVIFEDFHMKKASDT